MITKQANHSSLHEDDDVELSTITEHVTWGDHDYLFVTRTKAWAAAKTYCAQYDGGSGYHLVVINDEKEEAFLNTVETARSSSAWWIGLSDSAYEGRFVWVGGEPSAGMILTAGTCGVPGASVAMGDTWLRIKNTAGEEVGSNNDSGEACGTASNLSVTVMSTGTWWINAGCYGDTECSATVAYNY